MNTDNNATNDRSLWDTETLAHFERAVRGLGASRRTFLAIASALAGSAVLAACGGSSSPTATSAPTVALTKPPVVPSPAAAASPSAVAPSVATVVPPAAASTVAAPTAVPVATGPDSKKVFIDYLVAEPAENDANRDLSNGGSAQFMVGLLRYDQDFTIIPELAESYSNNGSVFTFKIRKDATWSDGLPITANDFVFSLKRQIDPRSGNGYGSYWSFVIKGAVEFASAKADAANLDALRDGMGVKVIDDSTLEITGDKFAGLIPNQLAYLAAVVAREDVIKKYADAKGISSWTDPGKIGGPVLASGPFQLVAWKHNQQLDYVRNDKYWNAKSVRQKYVTLKIVPDIIKSTLAFENGDVDYQIIPSSEVDRFRNSVTLKSQVFQYVYPGTRFLVPDTGHPPFDKLEVRKAVILSIDKDRLVNQVGKKIHTSAFAMTAAGVFGYFDDDDNKLKNLQKFDKAAAMNALKGTTFEGGRNWPTITLSYNTADQDIPTGYPDEIVRQLKESLNMDVQLEPLENKVWNARRYALDLQFLLYRWYQDFPDPHNNYYNVFAIHTKGNGARQSWADQTYDGLVLKAAAETDKQKRLDLYYQAETRLQTQFAYMPIHWRTDNYAIKPYVQNVPKNKQGYVVMNTNIFARLWDKVYVSDESKHDAPV